MSYSAYDIQRSVYPPTVKDYWRDSLLETSKVQFANSSSFLQIESYNISTLSYTTVDARVIKISSAKPSGQSSTSTNNTDDYREIIFGNPNTSVKVGDRYRFLNYIWLVTATDNLNQVTASCVVRRCNNFLKWYDDSSGILYSEPCAILDKMDDSGNSYDRSMVLPNGAISIIAQATDNVKSIKRNQRFLFGGQAFKVESIKNFISDIYTFDLYLDNIHEEYDDKINNIADAGRYVQTININQGDFQTTVGFSSQLTANILQNGASITKPVIWSTSNTSVCSVDNSGNISTVSLGSVIVTCTLADNPLVSDSINISVVATPTVTKSIFIDPVITELLEQEEQVFTISKLENGIVALDTFTCVATGALTNSYSLTVLNGNSIKLKNLKYSQNNVITLTFTSDVDSMSKSINIKLGGLW